MNGILFMKILVSIMLLILAVVSIWWTLEMIKPLEASKKQ